jgi:hypothetical protein
MQKIDGYKVDESCKLTEKELKIVQTCVNDEKFLSLDGKTIGRVLSVEEKYCKKVTGLDYEILLQKVLTEIDSDPWKAIRKLFERYGKEYKESCIPGVTAFMMQEYIDGVAAGKITMK